METLLRDYLHRHFESAGFLGEESGKHDLPEADLVFVVDPIDGTRAFVRGLPTWSVLLAACWKGVPVVGVAFMPQTGDLFVGAAGHGVTWNGKPVGISHVERLDQALVVHGALGQFAETQTLPILSALATQTHTQRGLGDFANYRELLGGRADAVVDPGLKRWDIAPAILMVREAGGLVTQFDGNEALTDGNWVASNGRPSFGPLEVASSVDRRTQQEWHRGRSLLSPLKKTRRNRNRPWRLDFPSESRNPRGHRSKPRSTRGDTPGSWYPPPA